MKMRKKERKFVNNIALGIALLILTNAVFVALSVLVSRYIRVYPKYFVLGLSAALILVLLINLAFIIGYYFKKRSFRKITIGLTAFFILVGGLATFYLYRSSSLIDQMIDLDGKENAEYVLLSIDEGKSLEDVYNQQVGYVSFVDDFESTINDALESHNLEQELVHYESLSDLVFDIIDGNIKYVILPKEYKKLGESISEDVNPFENSKVLLSLNTNLDEDSSTVDVSEEPFTILLMGNNEGLTDSIILASYNPKMQNVTMTSIPRDSYVPIACQGNRYDKVNHSRAISRKCFINTIENYIDVKVDFYFEADFYAIVKIVNALGGLEITSPVSFAGSLPLEDGTGYVGITVPEGTNVLNGEQVLTFARERHNMPRGDYDRQLNQQYVIKQIVSKIVSTRNPNKLLEVLDSAKNNIVTNLSIDSITALMGHAIEALATSPLKAMDAFRIESTQILGAGDFLNSGMWVMRPYKNDVRNATILITNNLKNEITLNGDTDFSFSYRNPYVYHEDYDIFNVPSETLWSAPNGFEDDPVIEEPIEDPIETPVEETPTEETPVEQTPTNQVTVLNFSNMSDSEISAWGNENGINIVFSFYETDKPDFNEGQFWYQSIGSGTLINSGSTIEIVRVKIVTPTPPPTTPGDNTSGTGDSGSN